jgi:hypothetical protein
VYTDGVKSQIDKDEQDIQDKNKPSILFLFIQKDPIKSLYVSTARHRVQKRNVITLKNLQELVHVFT